ncbi:MAG: DUF1385 domain-containing protein [Clostridia bacterium]|nr:DUF1385 domain-containing protein [Clostridia bacterium]
MKKKCCESKEPQRLGKVGGQAVIEGVMMKAGEHTVTSCRRENGEIFVKDSLFVSSKKKHKILGWPFIRGTVNFIETMKLSVSTMGDSAEALGLEEEESKFEKWMKEKLHISVTDFAMVLGVVLGLALSVFLFIFLPAIISGYLGDWLGWTAENGKQALKSVTEGGVKIVIFLVYLYVISLLPDIKRTFMYHGAEHKSIACFEAGAELTPENAMKYKRFHPRCGTSFMFVMILLGVFAGFFIRLLFPGIESLRGGKWIYSLIRIAILPVVVGIGYEYIMYAGKHPNVLTRILSAPGLWVQRLTTKEPTADMLEVAITSLKCALRDEYPEFNEFYENRGWEKKPAPAEVENATAAEVPAEELTAAPAEEPAPLAQAEAEADAPNDTPAV